MKRDLYQEVTDKIIQAIETNPGNVAMPWHRNGLHGMPENVLTGAYYQGINIVTLWVMSETRGYSHNLWGTYKQWQEKGAQVRKGEKSTLVIFYKEYEIENDEGDKEKRPMIRASSSFNVDQVDGFEPEHPQDHGPIKRVQNADAFVSKSGATIEHWGAKAYYTPLGDLVIMPEEGRFIDTKTSTRTEGYYSTLFHELTHWTGPKHRLDRDMSSKQEKYAFEELVAELGASFLCAKLCIEQEPRPDHAAYIANWLQALKRDKKFIFQAAARAQEAVNYLEAL